LYNFPDNYESGKSTLLDMLRLGFDDMGGLTFNLLNVSTLARLFGVPDLYANKMNAGLFEVQITTGGVDTRFGTGGIDLSELVYGIIKSTEDEKREILEKGVEILEKFMSVPENEYFSDIPIPQGQSNGQDSSSFSINLIKSDDNSNDFSLEVNGYPNKSEIEKKLFELSFPDVDVIKPNPEISLLKTPISDIAIQMSFNPRVNISETLWLDGKFGVTIMESGLSNFRMEFNTGINNIRIGDILLGFNIGIAAPKLNLPF